MIFSSQQQIYLAVKKDLYHDQGKQNLQSVLQLKNLEDILDLISVFEKNIATLIENQAIEIGYCGKEFFLNYHSDNEKNKVSFSKSFSSYDSLKKIISSVGTYLPILMFFDEDECITAIECIHTKYSLRVIKELFEKQVFNNEQFLFIVKPANQQQLKEPIEFLLPKKLFQQAGFLLCSNYREEGKYIRIFSNDIINLWLLFKFYHKEASYYISKYMENFYELGIFPPALYNKNFYKERS